MTPVRRKPWEPPETDEEREFREAYVSPKRAREIRLAIEQGRVEHSLGPTPDPLAPLPVRCGLCGRGPEADCYLPAKRCPRERST